MSVCVCERGEATSTEKEGWRNLAISPYPTSSTQHKYIYVCVWMLVCVCYVHRTGCTHQDLVIYRFHSYNNTDTHTYTHPDKRTISLNSMRLFQSHPFFAHASSFFFCSFRKKWENGAEEKGIRSFWWSGSKWAGRPSERGMQVRNLSWIASCENVLHLFNDQSNQVMASLRFTRTPQFLMLCLSSLLSLLFSIFFLSFWRPAFVFSYIFVGISVWQGGSPNNHKQTDKLARYLQCKRNETNRQQLAKFEWILPRFFRCCCFHRWLLLLKNKNGKLCALNWLIKNCRSSLLLV